MSKMDDLRKMREARYEQAAARAPRAATPPAPQRARPETKPATERAAARRSPTDQAPATAEPPATEALCGHRNMSGRTCTREQGHAAKSHRYS